MCRISRRSTESTFIYIGCNCKTGRRESDETVFIHFDIAVFADKEIEAALSGVLHRETPDAVFSFNFFPVISQVCKKEAVRYDLLKGFFTQVMLDLAGVFRCGLLVDAQRDEKAGQHFVPFIYIGCNLKTGRREGDESH